MKTAIYPGTFDPVTNGHMDIIDRAGRIFDRVIVTVARNSAKTPLFSAEERLSLIETVLSEMDSEAKLEVELFNGLIVDHAASRKATAIIRGLRAVSDFEYEFQMALMNRRLSSGITTVFLMPHERYTYLNSSIVREVSSYGGDVSNFVPRVVEEAIRTKYAHLHGTDGP